VAGYETLITSAKGSLVTITLNRPGSRNSLNTHALGDIRSALEEFKYGDRVGVVVFTGAGDKAFAAGADIEELRERTMLDALPSTMQAVYEEVEAFEKPTIAAVNGYALGGGCGLAMACDIRLASENARFGQPEVTLANPAGSGRVAATRAPHRQGESTRDDHDGPPDGCR
jgi:enoyl-CoA hydratase/carnithine racemase